MSVRQFLEVGQIVGTRGISGEMKVKSFCDSPQAFCEIPKFYFSPGGKQIQISTKRAFRSIVLITIDGIRKIEDCMELINMYIYADKKEISLPKNRYFVDDVIGMNVVDADTRVNYGKVCNVIKTGANDVYCVRGDDSKEYMLPAVDEFVISININKNILLIRPIKGMFDE